MKTTHNKLYSFLVYAALGSGTIIEYEPMRHNGFVKYDDFHYLTENLHVQAGLTAESIIWAFTTSHSTNWHPLTWLSIMLDCELFGLNPFGHHLVSLLLHTASTLLLFWVLKRMTGAIWCSGFVAAAFALHPVHVESVAWVAERKDVLSGLFWMLTMAAYVRYAGRPSLARYLLVALVLSLGLMAKPMLVTLPLVLLLLDYWPLERFSFAGRAKEKVLPQSKSGGIENNGLSVIRLIAEKVPLFVPVAASCAVTYIIQQSGGAVSRLPLNFRIANALISYIRYIGKMLYPSRLAALYPHPTDELTLWQSLNFLLILVIVSAAVFYTVRRRRYLTVGWLWYLGTLAPVIGVVQVGNQAIADRYTYLPSIGFFIMVAWGIAELVGKWRYRKIVLGILAGIIPVILLICTRVQVRYWRDSLTLFGRAIAVTKNNCIMYNNYGHILCEQGRFDEALEKFNEALRIDPHHPLTHYNIGVAKLKQGKYGQAINSFTTALWNKPNWAIAYYYLGSAYGGQGKYELAIQNFNKAIALKPNHSDSFDGWGMALKQQGKIDEAVKKWKKAIEINPNHFNANFNLGQTMTEQGKDGDAIKYFNRALQLRPERVEIYHELGNIYYRQGGFDLAIAHWGKMVQLKPDSAEVLNNLSWLLATCKDTKICNPAEAVKFARRACELTGYENPIFLDTLAVAYAANGNFSEAIATGEKALALAQALGQRELVEKINSRLESYKSGQPYRRPTPAKP